MNGSCQACDNITRIIVSHVSKYECGALHKGNTPLQRGKHREKQGQIGTQTKRKRQSAKKFEGISFVCSCVSVCMYVMDTHYVHVIDTHCANTEKPDRAGAGV